MVVYFSRKQKANTLFIKKDLSMGKTMDIVELFNKGDNRSNNATITLLDNMSTAQQKAVLDMVNAKNKKAFDVLRKRGCIK